MRSTSCRWLLASLLCSCLCAEAWSAEPRRPNVVFILTDNHGAWTLGCYGNKDIRTPNIDRLAHEGTLFRRCFSSNAVCSPTRATFLTGLIPSVRPLAGAFDYNRAPYLQSFMEIRVEGSTNRVRLIPHGVNGPLRWRELQVFGAEIPAGKSNDDVVEIVVPMPEH